MRKLLLISSIAALLSGVAIAGPIVNGQPISDARINAIITTLQDRGQPITDQTRDTIKDQLITSEVLSQEAIKKGLEKSPEFAAEMANLKSMALANQLLSGFRKTNPVSDDDIQAAYDKLVKETPETKQYLAQHILVKTEAEAKAVLNALKKGKSFDKLAKEKSTDPGSKDKGGDLGWQETNTFVPPFAEALGKLAKGQVTTDPVKTNFGWHIIKLNDVRSQRNIPPLKNIREQVSQHVQNERIEKMVNALKEKAKIEK